MEQNKYEKLKSKFTNKDFENTYGVFDRSLYPISFIGNILSILFSIFLLYPLGYKTLISYGVGNGLSMFISMIFSLGILSIFEYLKREVIYRFTYNIIVENKSIFSSASWLISSIILIGGSFYFSVGGAFEFGSISENTNTKLEVTNQVKIDTLNSQYSKRIHIYELDNNTLRETNNTLRNKILVTSETDKAIRNNYQLLIDKNLEIINNNESKVKQLSTELENKEKLLLTKVDDTKSKNSSNDIGFIIFFVGIAILIESIIIIGIWFRNWYEYNLYIVNGDKMETKNLTKERYVKLLKYIYGVNGGALNSNVIGISKLKELLKDKSDDISNIQAFLDTFYTTMDNLSIFKLNSKRRVINMSLDKALKLIDGIKDEIVTLEDFR